MYRSIKRRYNFDPPATDEKIRAASRQFVRKVSGFNRPSRANGASFEHAVQEISRATRELLDSLVTRAPARDREVEAARARQRAAQRFST